jgi:hypothetical protein
MPVLGKPERLTAVPTPDPKSFADQWVHAWNAHDVEAAWHDAFAAHADHPEQG